MKEITTFTWGYWGWGTHTKEFVRIADAIERKRSFQPPIYVDIRLSRKVRAPGFREGAFESVLGCRRYRWLSKLGNARIGSGKAGIRILDPGGVEDLLQIVVDAARERHPRGIPDMEAINVYREAIKRTFAEVYQVMPETIDVSWADDTITERCSDHTFTHKIDRDDETTLEFISDSEDSVTIRLTDDERRQVQQGPIISAP
jgi:hypothetical protein